MSFSCGFYDAIDNDRTYSATQFGEMFDGLITDGIYATIGEAFAVVPGSGVGVKVKSGRAWFNKTWSVNTSDLPLTLEDPDLLLSRIDAIILEIDTRVFARNNSIKVITGSPGVDPEKPTLVRGDGVYQYPLAWVTVDKNVSVIAASKIENNIGIAPTPFVTGILKSITIDDLWTQWEGQFDEWFANIKNQLEGNVALNLQRQIDALNDSKVNLSDKATSEQISEGMSGKWVDANGLASYVDGVIKPTPGESTITKTNYPMVGQELSVSEHPELFAKIGYKYGLCDIDRIYIYPATSRENLNPTNYASMPQLGNRFYGYSLSYGSYPSNYKYITRKLYFSPSNFSTIFQQQKSGLIALLGETDTHAITIENASGGQPTSLNLNLYKFPASGNILSTPSSTVINVDTTVMNRLNLNLSPCIRGTTIKWPYLYTLNNLIYMGVVTISSYMSSPSFTTATVQIPTTSDTVNWTNDSLETGINRSIILDGKVYIHVVNKTGVTVIYVYDLFTSSWVSISSATKNLIADWTEKYSNFDYSNTAYDSFNCMKLGSVKAKLDGSLIEYGLIYVDPETKEIKTYEDTTCVMGSHMHAVYDRVEEFWYSAAFEGYPSMSYYNITRNVRYPKWEPRKYKTYFQFYKGKAAIIVLSIGKVSSDLFLGMSYFNPTDKLVPIQLYSDLAPLTGYESSFGIRQPIYQLATSQYGVLDEIIDNTLELSRKSIRSTCRFGNLNSLSIPIFANIAKEDGNNCAPGASGTIPLSFSQTNFVLSLKKPTASDICTDKFRLPDAHGAPLYLSV